MSSNQKTGAEATVDLLAGHGVKHIFGLCGDTSLPFYDALGSLNHGMEHILTRDERHAGYMADAYARVTGKPGVCEGPSGGGATYMLPALIEAGDSSVPILAITTDVATTSVGRFPLTELDQEALFKPVTKWNSLIRSPDVLPRMLRKAFREMTTGRPGSVHLGLPFDVQKAQVNADDIWADERFSNYPALPQSPNLNSVLEVLAALKAAKTPVIVCGGGVILAGGTAALAVFTEKLDIPVCTTVSGQGSLAETHPNCAGVVGSNGGQPAIRGLVDEADLIFYIGCRAGSVTTERWRSPKAGTTVVHMDNDPAVIGACYQTKAAMVCDARLGLEALISELGAVFGKNGTVRVLAAKTEKWKAFAPLAVSNKMPIKPERVLADLAKHLPDDAVVCADPGTPCPYFSAWFEWRKPGRYFITNRAHGALGFAIGASIGAQIGRPNAKVICATGDGSFGMSVGELETMKRLNLPITILVFSNSVFGWIKAGQKSGFGARYFSVDFSRTDHAAVAAAYGIKSFTAFDPSDLAAIFKKAVHFDGPTLVDIICEPLQDTAAPVSEWVA
jgi:acetolactate synthase-1/2/3 large subunit